LQLQPRWQIEMAYFFSRPWRDCFFDERPPGTCFAACRATFSRACGALCSIREKLRRENSLRPRRHDCHSRGPSAQTHDLRRSSSVGMAGMLGFRNGEACEIAAMYNDTGRAGLHAYSRAVRMMRVTTVSREFPDVAWSRYSSSGSLHSASRPASLVFGRDDRG
jgi:hypothetical protein